jgi:large subunit ribosomal protein L7/L12
MSVDDLKGKFSALSAEDKKAFLQAVLEELSVVQMNDLVKHLEEAWDVKAASGGGMMMAAAAGGGGADEAAPAAEKTEFDVILSEVGDSKLGVIKVVREITGLGIKEAKELVDAAPRPVKEKVSKAEAEDIQKKLKEAGAVAELK